MLPRLLNPPGYQQDLNAPVWLDLTRPPGRADTAPDAWQQARLEFLARLNERREPLRRALDRPLILVLPLAEKARIKALVPDLWAVRRFSLETGSWFAGDRCAPPSSRPSEDAKPFPLDATERSLVLEWQRLHAKGSRDRGALIAGGRAFDALRRRGRVHKARETALWMTETSRLRLADGADDPEALRDLSVSLDNVGQTDQALGDWEQARASYQEALELSDRLAAALPNHVDYKDLPACFRERLRELSDAEMAVSDGG